MSLISEFEDVFLSDPFFAEDIIYYVNGTTPVNAAAVIYRAGHRQNSQVGGRGSNSKPLDYDFSLVISRGDIPTVKERVDYVDTPLNNGDTTLSRFRVQTVIRQDSGAFHLGLIK
jgi:hypothetical protein